MREIAVKGAGKMTTKLKPYGSAEFAGSVAKVGKSKSPKSLADRMPSAELAAKVGSATVSTDGVRSVVRLNIQN